MVPFNLIVFGITLMIVLWLIQNPDENSKVFLNIPSIAVLMFALVVLSTDWSSFGPEFEAIRMFLAGLVAIPYVVASGFAFFLRVYAYMWYLATGKKRKKQKNITIESLLKK